MKTDFEHINWELLSKNLANEAGEAEKSELKKWLDADDKNRKLYEYLEKTGKKDNILRYVHQLDVEQALAKVKKRKDKVRYITLRKLLRIAAIFIITIGISWFIQYIIGTSGMVTIKTHKGERMEITLADGSEVSVNENSTFSYPKRFRGHNRKVNLTGEAYFKVSPDKTRPFTIEMDVAWVKVLGTEFNIDNQPQQEEITVMVGKGSVRLGVSKTKANSIVLKKGNAGKYDREKQSLSFEKSYNPNETAWKTKRLVFHNETLVKVADNIEEVYFVELHVEDNLKLRKISAIYDNQPVDTVMKILESTLNVHIIETGKNKYEIAGEPK
jgi:transmembrane sensor